MWHFVAFMQCPAMCSDVHIIHKIANKFRFVRERPINLYHNNVMIIFLACVPRCNVTNVNLRLLGHVTIIVKMVGVISCIVQVREERNALKEISAWLFKILINDCGVRRPLQCHGTNNLKFAFFKKLFSKGNSHSRLLVQP